MQMDNILDRYQESAHSTACHGGTLTYPIAALSEELGEVADVWRAWCSRSAKNGYSEHFQEYKDSLFDELGDVLWNVAELTTLMGVKLSSIYPGETTCQEGNETAAVLQLVVDAAKINGYWAKYIRKHNGMPPYNYELGGPEFDDMRKTYVDDKGEYIDAHWENKLDFDDTQFFIKVNFKLTELMMHFNDVINHLDFNLHEIMKHNIDKLAIRKANNTLGGAGSVERK